MSFGETLYYMMYEILSPYGMESSDADRNKWALFPFGDLTEDDKAGIQAAFDGVLQEIVAYLSENGLTIADLMENGEWKTGNENLIGLLSQLAESIGSTYDSTAGTLVFSADGSTINGVFPFVAVKAAAVATDTKYLINGSTLSAIGDAIRAKEGTTETYRPATMAQKITDDLVKPSGTFQIKNAQQVDVSSYQYAKVTDANLAAENIKKDVTILGVTGTHEGAFVPSLQSKSVTYTANGTATITPDEGYDGISSVDITVDVSGGGGSSEYEECTVQIKGTIYSGGSIVYALIKNGTVKPSAQYLNDTITLNNFSSIRVLKNSLFVVNKANETFSVEGNVSYLDTPTKHEFVPFWVTGDCKIDFS